MMTPEAADIADLFTVYALRIDATLDKLTDLHAAGAVTDDQLVKYAAHLRDAQELAKVQVIQR